MRAITAILGAFAATIPALASPVEAGGPSERVAFTCRAGPRVVSVVRSGSTLAYRSTRGGAVEIQVSGGRMAERAYSGGGELQASFVNGPWTYVVYERVVRTGFGRTNDPRDEAGVDVLLRGHAASSRSCSDPETQFDHRTTDDLPRGTFVDHYQGE